MLESEDHPDRAPCSLLFLVRGVGTNTAVDLCGNTCTHPEVLCSMGLIRRCPQLSWLTRAKSDSSMATAEDVVAFSSRPDATGYHTGHEGSGVWLSHEGCPTSTTHRSALVMVFAFCTMLAPGDVQ